MAFCCHSFRKEREIVRKEVISQKNEEMKAEMAKLSQLKDEQLAAAKQGWESKFKLLLDDVSRFFETLKKGSGLPGYLMHVL